MEMRYDLATNFDDELIERIAEFGTVKSLYGKLAADIIGGGRPSLVLPNISRKKLRKHIETAHKHNIQFNYLLNASCMDNMEFIAPTNREFMKFIKQIKEDETDGVTVSSPAFLKMIREQFPDLGISASIYLGINTLDKIKHFEKMGANEITLYHNFSRDFELLEKAIKISDKETSLRLIANNVCLHNCPYMIPGHANLMAHSSQSKHQSGGFTIDIYTMLCGLQKIKNPAEFLMAEWIRPEDVHYYEEVCNKAGRNSLTLKLTDRARTTDWLVNVVKAYAERAYEGNLFDIINFVGNKGSGKKPYAQIHKLSILIGAVKGKADAFELMKLEKATFLPEIYIDNRELDGFIDHFKKEPCRDKTCYTNDKPYGECKFCYNLAEKIVHINEEDRRRAINLTEDVISSITSGKMFKK